MEIRIESLLEGARRAAGTVVIIDVFRAFTTAAIALSRGAKKIVLVGDPDSALALRERGVGDYCMGETGGIRPAGFDFGNSPYELSQAGVRGKTLIQSTSAGTAGVCAAANARSIYVASLVVARATAEVILAAAPDLVTLVAMGKRAVERADEDEMCALYLRNLLQGTQPDKDAVRDFILTSRAAAKFTDPAQPHFRPQDRDIALQIDALDFAMRVSREDGLLIARPVEARRDNF